MAVVKSVAFSWVTAVCSISVNHCWMFWTPVLNSSCFCASPSLVPFCVDASASSCHLTFSFSRRSSISGLFSGFSSAMLFPDCERNKMQWLHEEWKLATRMKKLEQGYTVSKTEQKSFVCALWAWFLEQATYYEFMIVWSEVQFG